MHKLFLVARRELWQRLRTRSFILSTIGLPLIFLAIWGGTSLLGSGQIMPDGPQEAEPVDDLPQALGYVDRADLIERVPPSLPKDLFQAFSDVDEARAALERGDVDAYYVIAPDYRETGQIRRVSQNLPTVPPGNEAFNRLLLGNLLSDDGSSLTPETISRVQAPFQSDSLSVVVLNGEEAQESGPPSFLPFMVTMLVMIPLFTSGSYLLYSVTQEKSSRIMEILLVSLHPRDLLAGKLLGLGALTLIQYVVWGLIAGAGLLIRGQDLGALGQTISLGAGELLLALFFALGGYGLYAAIMAGVGALSPDLESTSSWVFVITLPMLLPIYLWAAITGAPNGALAVILSLFPFSAPVAMLMRMTSTTVPSWQILVSLILLALAAAGMVWLISRLFRVQTLLSGESFSVRRFWAALTQA